MNRRTSSLIVLIVVLLPSIAIAQWWGTGDAGKAAPLVTVTGEAVVNVSPDKCVITLGIESREKDVDTVQRVMATKAQSLIQSLKEEGIAAKDIQTDILMVDPNWEYYSRTGAPKEIIARQSFTVTVNEVKKVEEILANTLKSGANSVLGVDFQTSELRKYRDQARQMAIRAAREKAQLMAAELGLSGLTPYSLQELQTSTDSWYGWWWRSRGTNMSQNSVASAPGVNGTEGSTIPPGQIAVRAAVSVSFLHSAADSKRLDRGATVEQQ